MRGDNAFITTIQHYQEALACMEAASRYLRSGEVPRGFHPEQPFRESCSNSHHPFLPQLDRNGCSMKSETLTPPLSSGYESGGYMDLTNSSEGTENLVDNMNMQNKTGLYPSQENFGFYRPNAREPLRSYLARGKAYKIDFSLVEWLMERCTQAIESIQQGNASSSFVVKDSLQSLVESVRFQRRLLEKRKKKMERRASEALLLKKEEEIESYPTIKTTDDNDRILSAVAAMKINPGIAAEGLSQVAGLQDVKDILTEAFILPTQFPHLFQGGSLLSWSRLLLYGPPGTGKTKLARALAKDLKCPLYLVTPSMLLSSWLGETEKIIRELFTRARSESGPVIVFLDEIDSLCRVRSHSEDDITRRIKSELLVHLDCESNFSNGYMSHEEQVFSFSQEEHFNDPAMTKTSTPNPSQNNQLFIIAATNCPWDIDPAFLRRFEKRSYVELPQSPERVSILREALKSCSVSISPSEWSTIGDTTEGYSGADLHSVATAAAFKPIRELHTANFWRFTTDNKIMPCSNDTLGAMQYTLDKLPAQRVTVRPVEIQDVLSAIETTQRSIPQSMLEKYREYQNN